VLNRYAIIYPAFTFAGDDCADMPYLFIAPLHKCRYEQICGYSLGHEPVFYDTLEAAQKAQKNSYYGSQHAIVEFQVQNESVIKFTKLFVMNGSEKLSKAVTRGQNTFFKPVDVPVWKERKISDTDLSAKALLEFNKYYDNIVVKNKTYRDHKL
jgi:hypothetical protein